MTKFNIRVWDKDLNFIDVVDQGWRCDEPNKIVVPSDSKIGRFLLSSTYGSYPFMTIDKDNGERWTGSLRCWTFQRPFGVCRYVSAEFEGHPKNFEELLEALAETMAKAAEAKEAE